MDNIAYGAPASFRDCSGQGKPTDNRHRVALVNGRGIERSTWVVVIKVHTIEPSTPSTFAAKCTSTWSPLHRWVS